MAESSKKIKSVLWTPRIGRDVLTDFRLTIRGRRLRGHYFVPRRRKIPLCTRAIGVVLTDVQWYPLCSSPGHAMPSDMSRARPLELCFCDCYTARARNGDIENSCSPPERKFAEARRSTRLIPFVLPRLENKFAADWLSGPSRWRRNEDVCSAWMKMKTRFAVELQGSMIWRRLCSEVARLVGCGV